MSLPRCPKNGKLSFTDRTAARHHMAACRRNTRFRALTVYRCALCGYWHMTSCGKHGRKR